MVGALGYEKKFNARLARAERPGHSVMLCEPQTYMNSSGEAVGSVMEFFRVPASRLLVAVDDADLPFGEIRMRPGGTSGGHHGLESIEQRLGTRDYPRLRIGIGRQQGAREITITFWADFVRRKRRWWIRFWLLRLTRRNAGWTTASKKR